MYGKLKDQLQVEINSIRKELRNLRGMLVDSDRKNESLNLKFKIRF